MTTLILLPTCKKAKQLIQEYGEEWEILEKKYFPPYMDIGLLIASKQKEYACWIRFSQCKIKKEIIMTEPTILEICNAYESGRGHGEKGDGHEKGPYVNEKLNEAYEIGYKSGFDKYYENLQTFQDVLNNL